MGTLYKLDFEDGKSYVGITTKTIAHRFNAHACNARTGRRARLYAAWRKHGEPRLTVLAVLEDRELASTEIRAIAAYGTLAPNGYNMTPEIAKLVMRGLVCGRYEYEVRAMANSATHNTVTRSLRQGQRKQPPPPG